MRWKTVVAGATTLASSACGADAVEQDSSPVVPAVVTTSPRSVEAVSATASDARSDASPQQAETTSTTSPAGEACTETPQAPPFLVDGSAPGEPTSASEDGTTVVTWGEPAPPDEAAPEGVTAVQQFLGGNQEDFALLADSDQRITVEEFQADVVPIGDPPLGIINIEIVDDDGCLREYGVGPGLELEEAIAFTRAWLVELAGGQATAPTTTTTAPAAAPNLPESK